MQILLEKMKPQLEKAAKISAEMIVKIAQDTVRATSLDSFRARLKWRTFLQEEAEKAREEAAEQEREATKLKQQNEAIRDEAETDLSKKRK